MITMSQYFNEALGNFVSDVANGGTIRHLTDLGYSAEEIKEHLAIKISDEKLNELIRQRKIENGTLPPEPGEEVKNYRIVKEQTKTGKITFRKVEE
ncbi:MAG: hypothetical protein IIZ61_08635 [Lachnospiraceae bacterium]|nr:hypothetical protein [Lachnospiraceae bacterium]